MTTTTTDTCPAHIARANAREVLRQACALYVALELSERIPAAIGHPATDDLRELAERFETVSNWTPPETSR